MNRLHRYISSCIAVVLLTACASSHQRQSSTGLESGYCYPAVLSQDDSELRPMDSTAMATSIPAGKKYSWHSLMVANATGVLKNLKSLDGVSENSTEYLKIQQHVLSRLFLVSTEIESIAAELDCEGERADQLADFLTQHENQRVKRLTILSITSGALAGIGNAVLTMHGAAVAAAVVGGSISAALGLGALLSGKSVPYSHPRNLLSDFWTPPVRSSVYPAPIWYMLSEKYFSNSQKTPIVENMRTRWIKFEDLTKDGKPDVKLTTLLFGAGGKYNADNLRTRARMLNQVQATVKLMNQDLQGLVEEISK